MSFNRPPRLQKPLPTDIVKIPRPRGMPSKPGEQNWLTILLPLGAVLLSIILMVAISGSGMGAVSYLVFIPIMLATYLATIMSSRGQQRKYKTKMAEVKNRYGAELENVSARLKSLKAENEKTSRDQNPDVQQCMQRVKAEDVRLGERRPSDSDFLSVRLGAGEDSPSFKIEPFDEELEIEELKEELDLARGLPRKYQFVQNVPITVQLMETGSIGFSGSQQEVYPAVRAFLCNLLALHWPTEVQVAVSTRAKDWQWIEETPHCAKNLSNILSTKDFLSSLEALLHNREQVLESQKAVAKDKGQDAVPLPVYLIIFESADLGSKHPAIKLLLDKGKKLGILGIFITGDQKQVPSKCGAIVQVTNAALTLKQTGKEGITKRANADKLSLPEAQQFARSLDQIEWPDDLSTNPPELITLLDLLGHPKIEDLPVKEWWEASPNKEYLRAPIGLMSPTSPFIFDINDSDSAYGPHGVLGGMTGSGKSEVLKTILLALAVRHHPYDVNFALIDYKGGSAFNELDKLPHTVGVMTNIESHSSYAERIILALTGEIETREQILGEALRLFGLSRPHIDDYRKLKVKKPLPRLIIVFDEFAEFKQKHQEESRRLISIARKGRSLGIHLILATQNIPSAVDPEVLQNSSFRICLKVSDAQDSMQLVGVPDAVNLPRGRAIFLSKNRTQLQVAFSGGEYSVGERTAEREYVRVWPDGRKDSIRIRPDEPETGSSSRPTQASKIVQKIIQTANELNLAPPPKVWPDPLSNHISLEEIFDQTLVGGWDGVKWQPAKFSPSDPAGQVAAPVLGMYDVPMKQKQYVYQLNQAQGGDHLLAFGSAGTGRSTLLRALIISSVIANAPDAVSFYVIDYGGQSALSNLQDLPHVGAVATKNEREKTERIIQYLHSEMNRRNGLFAEKKKNNWREYNRSADEKLAVIFLVIDNFREFKAAFQMHSDDFLSSLDSLMSGSSAAGIFLAISANTPGDLSPTKLADNINQKISLFQVDSDEYGNIVGRPAKSKLDEEVNLGPVPGRGYLRATPPLEFQVALALGSDDTWKGQAFDKLAEKMGAWKGKRPLKIDKLPLLIPLTLSKANDFKPDLLWFPLGKEYSTLETLGLSLVEDGPYFWIASQSNRQGKTALIKAALLSLAKLYSEKQVRITFVDFHGGRQYANFAEIPHSDAYVAVEKQFKGVLADLIAEKQARQGELDSLYEKNPKADSSQLKRTWPHLLIVMDDFGKLLKSTDPANLKTLEGLSQNARELGISFIIGSRINEFPSSGYDNPLGPAVKAHGCGVLLGGSEGLDSFNNTTKPKGQPNVSGLPPGRGFLINRNLAQLMHAYAYWGEGEDMEKAQEKWLAEITGVKSGKRAASA